MTTTRRAFLSSVAAAGAALPLAGAAAGAPPRRKPMKLLVLGGTAFLGPHFVRAATPYAGSVWWIAPQPCGLAKIPTAPKSSAGFR